MHRLLRSRVMPGPTPEGIYQSLHDIRLVIDTLRCLPLPPKHYRLS